MLPLTLRLSPAFRSWRWTKESDRKWQSDKYTNQRKLFAETVLQTCDGDTKDGVGTGTGLCWHWHKKAETWWHQRSLLVLRSILLNQPRRESSCCLVSSGVWHQAWGSYLWRNGGGARGSPTTSWGSSSSTWTSCFEANLVTQSHIKRLKVMFTGWPEIPLALNLRRIIWTNITG